MNTPAHTHTIDSRDDANERARHAEPDRVDEGHPDHE